MKRMNYMLTKSCHIQKKRFEDKFINDKKHQRIGDHCHCTGKYRDVAHNTSNLGCSIVYLKKFLWFFIMKQSFFVFCFNLDSLHDLDSLHNLDSVHRALFYHKRVSENL